MGDYPVFDSCFYNSKIFCSLLYPWHGKKMILNLLLVEFLASIIIPGELCALLFQIRCPRGTIPYINSYIE